MSDEKVCCRCYGLEPIVTMEEAARFLRLSSGAEFIRYADKRGVRLKRVGKTLRVWRDDVIGLLEPRKRSRPRAFKEAV